MCNQLKKTQNFFIKKIIQNFIYYIIWMRYSYIVGISINKLFELFVITFIIFRKQRWSVTSISPQPLFLVYWFLNLTLEKGTNYNRHIHISFESNKNNIHLAFNFFLDFYYLNPIKLKFLRKKIFFEGPCNGEYMRGFFFFFLRNIIRIVLDVPVSWNHLS